MWGHENDEICFLREGHHHFFCFSGVSDDQHCNFSNTCGVRVFNTVIKPDPARRVDPAGQPGGWTGPGLIKDRLWQQPGQTRATWRVDPEPG